MTLSVVQVLYSILLQVMGSAVVEGYELNGNHIDTSNKVECGSHNIQHRIELECQFYIHA